ncbi:hypothetical protein ACFPIJ_17505 [Dactylosporangium cerinum]|uniref:Uncharacterized protein n=1 Tax=Dactylosporangium cerinum TaxID=1434730 RepID=A0ABV9VUY5_9ACTN
MDPAVGVRGPAALKVASRRSLDRPAEARQRCRDALDKARQGGFRLLEAHALAALGEDARALYDECGYVRE